MAGSDRKPMMGNCNDEKLSHRSILHTPPGPDVPHHHHHLAHRQREPGYNFSSDYHQAPRSGTRNGPDRITLPPIRQAVPEINNRDEPARTPPSAVSPIGNPFYGTITPPEYVVSPTRCKRRLSSEDGRETNWHSRVPRPYANSQQSTSRPQSPFHQAWTDVAHSTSHDVGNGSAQLRSPVSVHLQELRLQERLLQERAEVRPTLPSLPTLNLDRNTTHDVPFRVPGSDEHVLDLVRGPAREMPMELARESAREPARRSSWVHGPSYAADGYGYGPTTGYDCSYQPERAQSFSVPSHSVRSPPFSPQNYPLSGPDIYAPAHNFAPGQHVDGRQRRRRGNLPRGTTDILRAWFMKNLGHPYPTEDEKQTLMRDTGLQINQISNWFINARRRQLPTLISNARVASDAMNGRTGDRGDYGHDVSRRDSQESSFGAPGTGPPKRRRTNNRDRDSL